MATPHTTPAVILPILIFGSSFAIELHLFLKQLAPVRVEGGSQGGREVERKREPPSPCERPPHSIRLIKQSIKQSHVDQPTTPPPCFPFLHSQALTLINHPPPPPLLLTSQVLTLAGPAVLVSTAILGVTVKYLLPYEWNWPTALMVGSMLW